VIPSEWAPHVALSATTIFNLRDRNADPEEK
jgi:hypothetical protein